MFPTCPPIHALDHGSLQSLPWELEWVFGSTDVGFGCVICFGQRNVSDGKWAQTFRPSVGLGWSSVLLLFPKGRHASGYHWSAENKERIELPWSQPWLDANLAEVNLAESDLSQSTNAWARNQCFCYATEFWHCFLGNSRWRQLRK